MHRLSTMYQYSYFCEIQYMYKYVKNSWSLRCLDLRPYRPRPRAPRLLCSRRPRASRGLRPPTLRHARALCSPCLCALGRGRGRRGFCAVGLVPAYSRCYIVAATNTPPRPRPLQPMPLRPRPRPRAPRLLRRRPQPLGLGVRTNQPSLAGGDRAQPASAGPSLRPGPREENCRHRPFNSARGTLDSNRARATERDTLVCHKSMHCETSMQCESA
jgi:hypothetical protein